MKRIALLIALLVAFVPARAFATVAWESASTAVATTTSQTSFQPAKPTSLAVGDLMLAICNCADSRTFSTPTGWTSLISGGNTDGTNRTYFFTKVADSSDVAATNFTFTCSATFNGGVVSLHRISGASTNAPTTGFATGTNSQTQTAPTITTPSNNCLVFWGCYHAANDSSTASKGTERTDVGNATGGAWQSTYTNLEATAGSITGAVITTTGFGAKRVFSIAIESAAGGGGGGIAVIMGTDRALGGSTGPRIRGSRPGFRP